MVNYTEYMGGSMANRCEYIEKLAYLMTELQKGTITRIREKTREQGDRAPIILAVRDIVSAHELGMTYLADLQDAVGEAAAQ